MSLAALPTAELQAVQMHKAGRITLACIAILAWVAAARAGAGLVHAVMVQHWVAAVFLLVVIIVSASVGLWISEFLIGLLLNQRTVVVATTLPLMSNAPPLDPSTLKTANDVLTEDDLMRAHNDPA